MANADDVINDDFDGSEEQPKLSTRWSKNIDPLSVLSEYPRSQFIRNKWKSLNGFWDYKILSKDGQKIENFDGQILVPFPLESPLSGVGQILKPKEILVYRHFFYIPNEWIQDDIYLHFGAVDWECSVEVNGNKVGSHKGGYTPFSFDITPYIKKDFNNELIVRVRDPTDKGLQERGKQVVRPWGIFYTPTSGIWQTVWIEPVPKVRIESVKLTPDIDKSQILMNFVLKGTMENDVMIIDIKGQNNHKLVLTGRPKDSITISIDKPNLWSPDNPYLYDVKLSIERKNQTFDEVSSYFGMRKISLGKDEKGITRMCLNNKPVFQYGPLDQGFWPDGIYTAPSDDALKYDLDMIKELSFNMVRKHVKVEPDRWYYYCDKMGLLVWQDMPNGGKTSPGAIEGIIFRGKFNLGIGRSKREVQQNYYNELTSMINSLYNHPSIIMWVPFNEGWGQFNTEKAVELIKSLDKSRLINNASGWTDRGIGDIHDIHKYPDPQIPELEENRAVACGEFGGLGYVVEGHVWNIKRKWGYRKFDTVDALKEKYADLMNKLRDLVDKGLSAAVYTQITDVEGEVNGLFSYDREVLKMDKAFLQELHRSLYK